MGKDVQFLSFNVYRDNVPVIDAEIKFRFKNKVLVQVNNQSYSEAATKQETQEIDPSMFLAMTLIFLLITIKVIFTESKKKKTTTV